MHRVHDEDGSICLLRHVSCGCSLIRFFFRGCPKQSSLHNFFVDHQKNVHYCFIFFLVFFFDLCCFGFSLSVVRPRCFLCRTESQTATSLSFVLLGVWVVVGGGGGEEAYMPMDFFSHGKIFDYHRCLGLDSLTLVSYHTKQNGTAFIN